MRQLNYILGLDLGIASVGWSVVEIDENNKPKGLIDLGVRVFSSGENAKDGKSLNLTRRNARLHRRTIRRRAHRISRAKLVLKKYNLINADFDIDKSLPIVPMLWAEKSTGNLHTQKPTNFQDNLPIGIWGWRILALQQKLDKLQWANVLLHIIKHRGYLSTRKNEVNNANDAGNSDTSSQDKELGKLLAGVKENNIDLQNNKYRSVAELVVKKFSKTGHLRNQAGEYSHSIDRKQIQKELHLLFEKQREFGNEFASEEMQAELDTILMQQRPALAGDALLKMVGNCSFEKDEKRTAKACYSFERFMLVQKLNNLRIIENGLAKELTEEEYKLLLNKPYELAKLTYTQIRKALNLSDKAVFKGLSYSRKEGATLNDTEKATFVELKSYHDIRKALQKADLEGKWQNMQSNIALMDDIGIAFSIYKTDSDIVDYLQAKYSLEPEVIDALLSNLSFNKFGHLSLKAIKKILPKMENEKLRYDEACRAIYGDHYGLSNKRTSNKFLPVIPAEDIVNPVVIRTLAQARKLINAVIRQYGSPVKIHIESARDLSRSRKERDEIQRRQKTNEEDKKRAFEDFQEIFDKEPSNTDILKKRLYDQQHGKCLYSGKMIDIHRLTEKGYVEIDHALPFSRSFNNSFNNKVLVLASENQNKGNKTPYEYFDGKNNSDKWQEFKARVNMANFDKYKKHTIMLANIEKEFLERNLNDTRYISRYLKNFIGNNLQFAGDDSTRGKQRVFTPNGRITSMLRGMWGFPNKDRDANNRHHALDAIVVACTSIGIQKHTTDLNKTGNFDVEQFELLNMQTGEYVKIKFPQPWQFFHEEIKIRVFSNYPIKELQISLPDRPEAVHEFVRPLFVSRAPTHKVTGQGHAETLRSAKLLNQGFSVAKLPLTKLTKAKIKDIVGYDVGREKELYAALAKRLDQFNNKPELAFEQPFFKPSASGKLGQQIKSVRIKQTQKSGVLLFHNNADKKIYMQYQAALAEDNTTPMPADLVQPFAMADNGAMIRIDVFCKPNKKNKNQFYIVPVYAHQVAEGILPNRAIKAGKDEREWPLVTDDYEFLFSLYSNDLVKITKGDKAIFGYYISADRSNGTIGIKLHDASEVYSGNGVLNLDSFEKYQVDLLGNYYKVGKEKRQGFNKN